MKIIKEYIKLFFPIVIVICIMFLLFYELESTNDYVPKGYTTKYDDFVQALTNMDTYYIMKKEDGPPLRALEEVMNLHPEMFWVARDFIFEYQEDSYKIKLHYTCPKIIAKIRQIRLNWKLDQVAKKAMEQESEVEILRYIHDYLISTTDYTYETVMTQNVGNAYGCLIKGDALCQGYTHAFTLLANRCGIECGPVINSNHIWNYVVVDGKEYMVDVTWDDPGWGKTTEKYTYFMLTPEEMRKSHNIQTDFYQYRNKK